MLTKMKDGKEEVMSVDEENAIRAEWAANDNKPPEAIETVEEKLNNLLSEFDKIKKDVEDLKKK